MKPRSSRRLFAALTTASTSDDSTQLVLPTDCELVAGTFVVFKWENSCSLLPVNATLYCWGRQRSGAIEHVLAKYDLTQSSQLYRINSKLVSGAQWAWLKQIFVVVHRLFDDGAMCENVGKVRWINIMQCGMAYEVTRRECYRYHTNLYPKGSALTSFLKLNGLEVEPWYDGFQSSSSADETCANFGSTATSSSSLCSPPSDDRAAMNDGAAVTPPSSGSASSANTSRNNVDTRSSVWGDREWLSDVHIANVIFLLLHGQLPIPLEHRDLFQCVYPLTDQLLEHMLYRFDPGSLLMHTKADRGITLVFVNPNSNHWRLVILDGLHRQVILFDPLGVSLPASLSTAVREFVGLDFRVMDMQCCLQAAGWNCGVWALYIASKYVSAVVERVSRSDPVSSTASAQLSFQLCDQHDEYTVLTAESSSWQRYQNRAFANEVRK